MKFGRASLTYLLMTTRCGLARWSVLGHGAVAILVCLTTPAVAIQPSHWVHTTEADFAAGETDYTVVTNLGDVKLAKGTELIAEISEHASIIHDLQVTENGKIFLAVGPRGALLCRKDDQVEQVVALPDEQVFALDVMADGRLLVAVSAAPDSRLAVINGEALETLVSLEGIRYIWDILVVGDQVVLATGTEGRLLRVDLGQEPDQGGEPVIVELLDTAQDNLLCLGRDAFGRIYTGTDGEGLIYRLTLREPDTPEIFVLYDAPEPEIGALLVNGDGTVYAGTADADQARPGRLEQAATAESGRPERVEPAKQDTEPGDMPRVPPTPEPMDRSLQQEGLPAVSETQEPQASAPDEDQRRVSRQSPHRSSSRPPERSGLAVEPMVQPGHRSSDTAAEESRFQDGDSQRSEPTAVQRDRLRDVIRQRLEAARRSGTLNGSKAALRTTIGRPLSNKKNGNRKGLARDVAKEGNAVYRISPDGFVTEIFRESVMILKLLGDPADEGKLLVATGNEGQLFRVDPAAEETTILVDLDPQQVPAMMQDGHGHVVLGTANPARLLRLEAGFSDSGTYTSAVLDADQISLWGNIKVSVTTAQGTSVAVATRSGNVHDPEQAAWSDWTPALALEAQAHAMVLAPREATIQCPPARFMQYRLNFTGGADATPIVDRVHVTYVVPNLKPVISSIQAKYPDSDGSGLGQQTLGANQSREPNSSLQLEWESTDPNGDRLVYTLEYQPAGAARWITLAKDLEEQSFQWQTRRVPDGRYLVRVIASDHLDNPSGMARTAVRRADPVLVDNTAPTVEPMVHQVIRKGVQIASQAQDRLSPIRSVRYSIDSGDDWNPVMADDLIYDSTRETFTVNIPELLPGPHVVTVWVTDDRGNSRYEAVFLEID